MGKKMKKRQLTELTIDHILARLQKIRGMHGNMKVYFDTEAGQFNCHYVGIRSVWFETLGGSDKFVYMTTDTPIEHICRWMDDNIKVNFAAMAKMGSCKSQWQLCMFNLPVRNSKLPQTHESDKEFFKKYWKLDKTPYEKFMKSYFPGWLK